MSELSDVLDNKNFAAAIERQTERIRAVDSGGEPGERLVDIDAMLASVSVHVGVPVSDIRRVATAFAVMHSGGQLDSKVTTAVRDTFIQAIELGHILATEQMEARK